MYKYKCGSIKTIFWASSVLSLLTACGSTMKGLSEDFKVLGSNIGDAIDSKSSSKPQAKEEKPTSPYLITPKQQNSIADKPKVYKGYSKSTVQQIQEKLNQLGYDTGEANGEYSANTEVAIQDFQLENDLTVNGKPSVSLLRVINSKL